MKIFELYEFENDDIEEARAAVERVRRIGAKEEAVKR
jgi:hypothetical protein